MRIPLLTRKPEAEARPRSRRFRLALPDEMLPWLSLFFLIALIAVPLCLLGWFIFFTNTFAVQAITVIDARDHTIATIKEIAETRVATTPFGRSIFFVQTDLIEGDITGALPHVRTVQARRQLPGTVRIVIQEKNPILLLFSKGDYFLVDANGIPYEEARIENLPGIVLPTVKNNDTDATVQIGVPAVSESFVDFVQVVQENLPTYVDADIAEIRIPSLAAREVHFHLSNNWQLKFDVTRSVEQQLRVLQRVINESIPVEEQATLEYIDLRIPDRVYYKSQGFSGTPETN